MPRGDPFLRSTDIDAIKKIAKDAQPLKTEAEGIVMSVTSSGAMVQLRGASNWSPAEVVQGLTVKSGDQVFMRRSGQVARWVIINVYNIRSIQGSSNPAKAADGSVHALVAPSGFSLIAVNNALVVKWVVPGTRGDIVYELEVADDDIETNQVTYRVAGNIYYYALAGGSTKYLRVRSVKANTSSDLTWERSGWTDWAFATALNPYDILADIVVARGEVATANGEVWWNE